MRLAVDNGCTLDDLGAADAALGAFIGHACKSWLAELRLQPSDITAIGSHGQTVRHRPPVPGRDNPFTLQIGDPARIAATTGIQTIADFRRADLAAGGEGAPFAPLFHDTVLRAADEHRWILNLGGIANLTRLHPGKPVQGFDTGPANALMDAWIQRHHGLPFDHSGQWGAGGTRLPKLLDRLLSHPYFDEPAPKSTGKEQFNLAWLDQQLAAADASAAAPQDVQRTLVELTALTVTEALKRAQTPDCDRLLLCGGGRHNRLLVARLAALLDAPVESTDQHGIDGDALEAGLFAWLAHRFVARLPCDTAATTGAATPRLLGALYPAPPET